MILSVSGLRNRSALAVDPTATSQENRSMLIMACWAVSESLSVDPVSLKRFPSIRAPTRGTAAGNRRPTRRVTAIGKTTFSVFVTSLSWAILTALSLGVVKALIMGGWMRGTKAM